MGEESITLDSAELVKQLQAHRDELQLQHDELQQAHAELGNANDELEQANTRLREAHDRLQQLYDEAPVGYATLDAQGTVIEANLQLASMLGRQRSDLLGQRFARFVARDGQDDYHLALRGVLDDSAENRQSDLRLQPAGGDQLWARADWRIVERSDGRLLNVTLADIDEQKRLHAQLAQADRMASVGLLAAGVAHEINNPLTYVLYNLESLVEDAADFAELSPTRAEDVVARLEAALHGSERIREIAKHLRVFSRIDDGRISAVDLGETLDTAIEMAFNEIKYRARLVKRIADISPVKANAGQLCQVFLNLLVNAAHAITEGNVDQNEIHIEVSEQRGSALVAIRDSGHGIAPEHRERIFEPFFTTKDVGEGSGLGLPICKKIIDAHHGRISVESRVGKGSTFSVTIPFERVRKPTGVRPRRRVTVTAPGRVLIVDDEPVVGTAVARMLAGHDVLVLDSAKLACDRIEAGERFDVILCDMMMPEMTGMDLHEWLVEGHPELASAMVFLTGGVFTPRAREHLDRSPNMHLEKPVDIDRLREVVNGMCARVGEDS